MSGWSFKVGQVYSSYGIKKLKTNKFLLHKWNSNICIKLYTLFCSNVSTDKHTPSIFLSHAIQDWNKPSGTRGNFQNTVQCYQNITKGHKVTAFLWYLLLKQVTLKGKFTANVRIYVIYYNLCDVSPCTGAFWQQIVAPGSWFFYFPRVLWAASPEQICAIAPVISRLACNHRRHKDMRAA